jgi:predicted amino acid racemase
MFLEKIIKRNPVLIQAAVKMHQNGEIPPNTWVIDLDGIAKNAKILSAYAKEYDLKTYVMSKEYARNPVINKIAIKNGLESTVAVDIQGAKILWRYGIPVGHIGHLNQVPNADIPFVIENEPEVITCYSIEKAKRISEVAQEKDKKQEILLRVIDDNDTFFDGQEGGIHKNDLEEAIREIQKMPNVELVGTTSFPCIRYNTTREIKVEPTNNFRTIVEAAKKMESFGCNVKQINAPGNTSSDTFAMLKENGATHVEPGHGLLGTTPNHAFKDNLPEIPTYIYLSEVSHFLDGEVYCYGGGYWSDIYDPEYVSRGLVGNNPDNIFNKKSKIIPKKQIIDYHITLENTDCKIGDSVIFGYRTQMQMTRSQIALVSGLSENKPLLEAIFDHAGTMISFNNEVITPDRAIKIIENIVQKY